MISQSDIPAIQQAIRQLTRLQREELAEWILNSTEVDDRVAEAKLLWGEPGSPRLLTADEYLQMESEGTTRYEFIDGEIFAMAGAVLRHEVIVTNVVAHFHTQLRGGPCKVFPSNTAVRLRVDRSDIFYLPDVTVARGPFTESSLDLQYLTNPSVVIEVLSPSTEAIDRREKALNYRHVTSLEEYVLIAQRAPVVTVYRRNHDWKPEVLTQLESVLEFRAVEVHLTLAEIYEGTR
jgi:Uma2 family endonuclease